MKTFRSYGKDRTDFTEFASWLATGDEFSNQTGTLRGVKRPLGAGRLPCREIDLLREDTERGLVDYMIYSYNTPIAWHVKEHGRIKARWEMPDVKYSNTTTQHQFRVATALETLKVWA